MNADVSKTSELQSEITEINLGIFSHRPAGIVVRNMSKKKKKLKLKNMISIKRFERKQ